MRYGDERRPRPTQDCRADDDDDDTVMKPTNIYERLRVPSIVLHRAFHNVLRDYKYL
jgi:hypothetical protein